MVEIISISIFTNFCTCLLLSVILFTFGKRYINFAIFNLTISFWSLFYGLYIVAEEESLAVIYARLTCMFLVLIPYIFFRTVVNLANFRLKSTYRKVNDLLAFSLVCLMVTPIMVRGVKPFLEFRFIPDTTVFYNLYYVYLFSIVFFGLLILFNSIQNNYKNKLLFYGFVIGWPGGGSNLLPYIGIEIYPVTNFLVALYTTVITYAIVRHRMLDSVIIITKFTVKFIVFITLIIFYVTYSLIYNFFEINSYHTWLIFNISFLIVSAELYYFLYRKFDSIREDISKLVPYKKTGVINKINSDILDILDIDELYFKVRNVIQEKMGIEISSFYVSSDLGIIKSNNNHFSKYCGYNISDKQLVEINNIISVHKFTLSTKYNEINQNFKNVLGKINSKGFVPFIYNNKKMGFITLKSRPNKKNYFYYEDMEVFDDLVIKVGIALERVRLHLQFMKEKELALISLAGSIAHELRNPLGAIKLTTDNLTSIKENSRCDENVKEVINKDSEFKETINNSDIKINNFKNQINKTIDLATDIIDMTLHEISGKRLTREDFDYYSAKKSVLDAIMLYGYDSNEEKDKVTINLSDDKNITASKAGDQTISVNNIKEDNDFIILTNNTGFKYIIFNLVKNALYYLSKYPDSDIAISFEKEKIIDQKTIKKFNISNHNIKIEDLKLSTNFKGIYKYNVINIIDTGPGIKEEIITKIFQPYTSYKKNGTGVGLDFCNRMMGNFGGAIICESKLGKYTKFSLLFPILSEQEEKVAIGQILELEDKIAQAEKKGENLSYVEKSLEKKPKKNILLIDDVKVNIDILARDLKNKCPNFEVVIMTCPVEAFKLIKVKQEEDEQFDLILTDIEMPLMNGIDLINKVRNELKISKYDLPILVYGSREDKVTINEALDAGCNSYYMKPKDLRFIARNISKWVLNDYMPSKTINNKEIIINNQTLKDLNIIIADDQLMNLMLVSDKISNAGANIFKCNDGGDIIKLMTEDPDKYHLIITDINMKRIGGIEAAMKVRNIEAKHNKQHNSDNKIPIIALSGDNDQKFVMNLLNNSIDDYMIKGSDPKNIIKLSRFWVDYRFCNHDILSEDNKHNGNNILRSDFISLFSNKSSAIKVINVFKKESDSIIQEIRGNKTDVVELQKSIHKLKGSSDLIATRKLFEYLSEINIITKDGKLPDNNNFDSIIEEYVNEAIDIMKLEIKRNFQI